MCDDRPRPGTASARSSLQVKLHTTTVSATRAQCSGAQIQVAARDHSALAFVILFLSNFPHHSIIATHGAKLCKLFVNIRSQRLTRNTNL